MNIAILYQMLFSLTYNDDSEAVLLTETLFSPLVVGSFLDRPLVYGGHPPPCGPVLPLLLVQRGDPQTHLVLHNVLHLSGQNKLSLLWQNVLIVRGQNKMTLLFQDQKKCLHCDGAKPKFLCCFWANNFYYTR